MTKQNLKARENSINLPPNLKFSGFRQTTKRKQGVFEKTSGHTRLLLQSKLFWITIVYFAINICFKIHLFRTKIECLLTVLPPFCYFCRHPVLHRADTPHVCLYTVYMYMYHILQRCKSIFYEKAWDWPNKNRNFTVQT